MRCGACCMKGGPTLHAEDRHLIAAGRVRREDLITIRKGELTHIPDREGLHPAGTEIVKISGKGRTWECLFFDRAGSSCRIYEHRPLECRILKCWDTAELLSVIGKDPLRRADVIDPEDPVLELIEGHEEECSVRQMEDLLSLLSGSNEDPAAFEELEELIQRDLTFRAAAVSAFSLPLSAELFMFGRPLFKLLGGRGVSVREEDGGLRLFRSDSSS